MGQQLSALFARAREAGGMALAGRLAMKCQVTSASAATLPDDTATVARVKAALEECLREGVAAAPARPVTPPTGGGSRIGRYFEFARQKGGMPVVVKLAARTGITSAAAGSMADDPQKLESIRGLLEELMPGVAIPAL